ncbi:MAG: hypothetical protein AB7V56_06110 [Candidatus Nitrosocosmicus sp.]|jgi:hypothetical protein|uniref:hypothetical protein n=1 Tax=Candidatus Nitrosocosmicus agrestis TaxID=2563600 RepID=UPI00122DD54D|nr:hypothetical protein [Candidatus Nitrosocosmicus sp. SS]KAA2283304.1 hypothetical protein F1Z66_02055 [Candidatus Nitrosocosmicus sp. SS]KAF0868447.1 hypothetical protein E5N71_10180 [Candidatus Nitrosocosmicus sp. SS]MDR4491900.1 hypothetical protein [Candidatus Nitrosocosmicus sp.]HET6590275.1 hypothetical protein [Candidatus Nitrosocosmicus sp.]
MVSYKPVIIAGAILAVIGLVGVAIVGPVVITAAIPDTDFNIQSPPNVTEFNNPMANLEIGFMGLIIIGLIVGLYGWDMKKAQKAALTT